MRFARHETFHFREGWLTKGLRKVADENLPEIFQCPDAMEHLGIGSNMVKSLRYWMQATNLTEEKKGRKGQSLTSFGNIVFIFDRYLEEEFTLWLLHYHLAKNKEMATAWYWFFNIFEHREFDEEVFLNELNNWVLEQGQGIAIGSLKKDFDCLLGTYLSNKETGDLNPEDNISCPLQELGLIELIDTKNKRYRLTRRNISSIPKELFLYGIMDYLSSKSGNEDSYNYIDIDTLLSGENNIGKIFGLGLSELIQVLEMLQADGFINLTKTAGLNSVSIRSQMDPINLLSKYYETKHRG